MDRKVTFKVFNRITGDDITHVFKYVVDHQGDLYLFDEIGLLTKATHVHEVRYD